MTQKPFRPFICFGTRPEAIKLAPIIQECKKLTQIEPIICSTGQHREMLKQVTDYFCVNTEVELNVMTHDQNLSSLTARLLSEISKATETLQPDCIIAQGDTTTVMVSAMVAFYQKTPFCHVEAGLRTNDLYAPWPEEFNRRLVGLSADFHFTPTQRASNALLREGVESSKIFMTGNTVIDALLSAKKRECTEDSPWGKKYSFLGDKKMILITGHRRENFGDGFNSICLGIRRLAEMNPDCEFLYPVHLNPNVQKPVFKILGKVKNIHLIKPAPYPEFIWLMNRCELMITDSGGVQEEGPSFKKPIIVTRETTERPEAVDAGAVLLVGSNQEKLVELVHKLLSDPAERENFIVDKNPYGDGQASTRIIDILISNFCKNN